jgi:chemotaxis protein histidine kinase CheA
VEEIDARAVLGVSANASRSEIEAAYSYRINQVRKQFDEARDYRAREKCKRERNALDEARSLLLDLEEEDQRQREEEERAAAEQPQLEENERLALEQRQREENDRLAAEQHQREENERLALEQRQREEEQRLVAEQHERVERERLTAEQRHREEQERLALEQRQREEQEHLAAEQREREKRERLAAEQRQREEQERLAAERRQREEQERRAAEQREHEQRERLAAEQRQRAEQERVDAANRLRQEKKRWTAVWLGIGAVLFLLAVIGAAWFTVDWQNKHKSGKLILNTVPTKAEVFVDDVSQGRTPLVLEVVVPGERRVRIQLKGYQDEELVVLIEPGHQRFFPLVTLVPKKEFASDVTPAPTSPIVNPSPISTITPTPASLTVTPLPTSPTETPVPTSPIETPASTSPTATPRGTGLAGERFPQTRLHILTWADVADLDYTDLQYAINEIYARHGEQFLKDPDIRSQFEKFNWYVPMPGMTMSRAEREFSRIERQNRDLLARARDQKRPK